MFVTQSKSPNKTKFLKPNILRKRPVKAIKNIVSTSTEITPNSKTIESEDHAETSVSKHKCSKSSHTIRRPQQWVKTDPTPVSDKEFKNKDESPLPITMFKSNIITAQDVILHNIINDVNLVKQLSDNHNIMFSPIETSSITISDKEKWCYVPFHSKSSLIKDNNHKQESKAKVSQTPSNIELKKNEALLIKEAERYAASQSSNNNITQLFPITTVKLKCDHPGCAKEFSSDRTLKIHKSVHNKPRTWKQGTCIKCPASKHGIDVKEPCGAIFNDRKDVLIHLKTEHTIDDAYHRCEACGRGFFWSSGMSAHKRACGCDRTELTCEWPGCNRVFYQPCRLKEHTRKHTGDRPYPCRYPNCTAMFRTSSKLVRHARRHTGERRYRCGTCGRAFLRGDHLRAHTARHSRPPPTATAHTRHRTHTALSEKPSILIQDVVESSSVDDAELVKCDGEMFAIPETPTELHNSEDWPTKPVDDPFMVVCEVGGSEPGEMSLEEGGEMCGTSARTHCTWPLTRPARAHLALHNTDAVFLQDQLVQVELSEVQENNVYTISSDLCLRSYQDIFLHEHIDADENEGSDVSASAVLLQDTLLDNEMTLLDTHPNIDLMQEELLYADVAADGCCSFQILPLTADELSNV